MLPPLKTEEVNEICKLLQDGLKITTISKRLGIPAYQITRIRDGKSHMLISASYTIPNSQTYPKDAIHEVCRMLEIGETIKDINVKTKVGRATTYGILAGTSNVGISSQYAVCDHFNTNRYPQETIHEVCKLLEKGESTKSVHAKTGVSVGTIRNLRYGSHTDITSQYVGVKTGAFLRHSKETIHEVCKLLEKCEKVKSISAKTGVPVGTIRSVLYGLSHTGILSQYDLTKRNIPRYTKETIHEVCMLLEKGVDVKDISMKTSVDCPLIYNIRAGNSNTAISRQYSIPNENNGVV